MIRYSFKTEILATKKARILLRSAIKSIIDLCAKHVNRHRLRYDLHDYK